MRVAMLGDLNDAARGGSYLSAAGANRPSSGFAAIEPPRRVSDEPLFKTVKQFARLGFGDEQRAMVGLDKVLRRCAIEKFDQPIVITGHVQQSAWLIMQPKLCPTEDFE